jgi:FKBP-type peptidyl-prolyl cis-trans isomerase
MISGRLLSGIEFDTNMMFGSAYSKTFDIVIGAGKMIRGMDAALKTMRVGEQAKVCTMFFSIFYICSYSENCTR